MTSPPTCLVVHPGAELFGSDRMMLESVRGLAMAGMRVIVALPERGPLVRKLMDAGAEVVIVPLLVLRKSLLRPAAWPTLIRTTLRDIGAAWRLLRRQAPHVVYVSTVTLPLWPLMSRLLRVPVVSHVHEAEASGSRFVNRVVYAPHLLASAVLVNSTFSRRTIAQTWPSLAARAAIVHNGVVGPDRPTAPREELDGLRVLYIGRLSPRKGVADAVRAIGELNGRGIRASLTILGSVYAGYEWFEQELRELVDDIGADRVAFIGFRNDIWPVLADHDVLAVPSRMDEPFGNTAVEGVLAGRPVIASDTSGLREAAGGYATTMLVPPGSPEALASAIADVGSRWGAIRAHLESAAAEARRRHAPEAYRAAIAEAVQDVSRTA